MPVQFNTIAVKTIFFFILIITVAPKLSSSQNMVITYTVTKDYTLPVENKTVTLNYTGYLYKKNNRYIYFEKPAYKQKIEDGKILLSDGGGNNYSSLLVDTDSLQCIVYSNFDSLEQRMSKIDGTGRNFLNNFEADWQKWNLLPDTKQINGLHCQKATQTDGNGVVDWEVWFCPDIPMRAGVQWLKNLPGLVVEAEMIPLQKHYSLVSHSTINEIPDTVFWPNEFNIPVTKGPVRKNTGVRKPTKAQRKSELLKNNN